MRFGRLGRWLLAAALLAQAVHSSARDLDRSVRKAVSVGIHTKWPCVPLHLEASEWLAEAGGPIAFWDILDNTAAKISSDSDFLSTDRAKHDWMVDQIRDRMGNSLSKVARWAIATRRLSLRVEFHASVGDELAHGDEQLTRDRPFLLLIPPEDDQKVSLFTSLADLENYIADPTTSNLPERTVSRDLAGGIHSDHRYPSSCSKDPTTPTVVLHADFGLESFSSWHDSLKALSKDCKLVYVLRHWFVPCNSGPAFLQGYSVEATLRNTEYLVVDDRQPDAELLAAAQKFSISTGSIRSVGGLFVSHPEEQTKATKFSKFYDLTQRGVLGAPLRKDDRAGIYDPWEKQDASLLAASLVLKSADPVLSFQELAEDFPAFDLFSESDPEHVTALKIAARKARKDHRIGDADEVQGVWLNGRKMDASSPNDIVDCITELETAGAALRQLKVPNVQKILSVTPKSDLGMFRANITALNPDVIYFNDLEKDKAYKSWSADYSVLVDAYLGALPVMRLANLKKNLLNFIAVVDPGDPDQLPIIGLANQITTARIPIRFGVILVVGEEGGLSESIATSIYSLAANEKLTEIGDFVEDLMESKPKSDDDTPAISMEKVESAFQTVSGGIKLSTILEEQSMKEKLELSRTWASKAGFSSDKKAPFFDLNGVEIHDISRQIMEQSAKEHTRIARLFKSEQLDLKIDVPSSTVVGTGLHFVPTLSSEVLDHLGGRLQLAAAVAGRTEVRQELQSLRYINGGPRPTTTIWIAGDFNEKSAISLAIICLEWFSELPPERMGGVRLSFLSLTSSENDPTVSLRSLTEAMDPKEKALDLIGKLERTGNRASNVDHTKPSVLIDALGLDEESVVVNGRKISGTRLNSSSDLDVYIRVEQGLTVDVSSSAVPPGSTDADQQLLIGSSIIRLDSVCESQKEPVSNSAMKIHDDLSESPLGHIVSSPESHLVVKAVMEPTNPQAPAVGRLVRFLREEFDAAVSLVMLPRESTRNPPATYRKLVLAAQLEFDDKGSLSGQDLPQAWFDRLPQSQIITLSVSTPRSWLIGSSKGIHDLDNIILNKISEPVLRAEYKLESLLVEGSCADESKDNEAPQGLKVELRRSPPKDGEGIDTLVMKNLGYFQLKASSPGRWSIRLAEGRSADMFSVQKFYEKGKHRYTAQEVESTGNVYAAVDNLNGIMRAYLVVTRRPGKEKEQLLDPDSGVELDGKSTVHIFSVASGHLYERFMRIMILSVLKNTKAPVKFWMLGNYLSPSFKTLLPGLSRKYGFEYEFVTYQWPGWLREQTEKQRIIWAYKILFLDVLFPLSVPRIIFVDADQVVRGDISELYQVNLDGAPYGYVPFCSSRKDVDGYRFWKGGFWETHLAGNPYHISALYVVDLHRFREAASGDMLRAQYQSLSADPNSLSNLDQDLPNYVASPRLGARGVRIFSLPSKWLWCESWCDEDSKIEAQVIDLCNNPMTREPKLQSARRIVVEWSSLDDEATASALDVLTSLAGEKVTGGHESEDKVSTTEANKQEQEETGERPGDGEL